MALSVPLSRFTSRVGGGSVIFVRRMDTPTSEARWKGFVFRCLATQNIVVTVLSVIEAVLWSSDRVIDRYLGAIWLASIGLLALCSFLYLFFDRKRAVIGFGIAIASLFLGMMCPEL